jgi:hypothetical protein
VEEAIALSMESEPLCLEPFHIITEGVPDLENSTYFR